jgi:hypothetical protein
MSDGRRLAICLPQTEMVRNEYARSLAEMTGRVSSVDVGLDDAFFVSGGGSLLPAVRQKLAERAIENRRATHLLWIDSDHSFPADTAHRLLAHQRPIVGINATTRTLPLRCTAAKGVREVFETTRHSKGLERCRRIGFGIVLVEARVFLAMPKPWFQVVYLEDEGTYRGEDVYFCEKAREHGFHPMVDHDLTKETTHIGSVGWSTEMLETEAPLERVA